MSSTLTPVIAQGAASHTSLSNTQNPSQVQRGQQGTTEAEQRSQLQASSQAASVTLKSDSKAEKSPQVPKKVERPYTAEKKRAKSGRPADSEENEEPSDKPKSLVDFTA